MKLKLVLAEKHLEEIKRLNSLGMHDLQIAARVEELINDSISTETIRRVRLKHGIPANFKRFKGGLI